MRSHTPPPSPRCFEFIPLLLAFFTMAPSAEAGHGVNPFGTRSPEWGGSQFFITPHAGWTFREVTPATDPESPPDTTDPGSLVLGLSMSAYKIVHPVFIPGVGLGFYLDDGAFSIDLVPKIGTLFGTMGLGAGLTLRDGEPGWVYESWASVFAGLRLRKTWVGGTDRTSVTLFVAVPMGL